MTHKFLCTTLLLGFLATQESEAVPNPASVYCIEKGGKIKILKSESGDSGICLFPDGKQCEEWAMIWGYCPVGGLDIAHLTPEEGWCLITGGTLLEKGTKCKLFTGKVCGLKDYYIGKCDRHSEN